jgi:hypothetical protein
VKVEPVEEIVKAVVVDEQFVVVAHAANGKDEPVEEEESALRVRLLEKVMAKSGGDREEPR